MSSQISDATRFKRGRGEGTLENYDPWIWVTDFSSSGLKRRVWGVKIKRVHHLLSLLETRVYFILEANPEVLEVREQHALLPLSETIEIAAANNIRHPMFKGKPIVMTTDFLVIKRDGCRAINVKYKNMLGKKRAREKAEIERIYWDRRGIKFFFITNKDITINAYKNAERNRCFVVRPDAKISNQKFINLLKGFRYDVNIGSKEALRSISKTSQEPFAILHHLFLHLIFHQEIKLDCSKVYAINSKISDLCL